MNRAPKVAAGVLALVVLAGGAGVGGYAITDAARHRPAPAPKHPVAAPPPQALRAAGATPTPTATSTPGATPTGPSAATITGALRTAARATSFGGDLHAQVINVATGAVLYGRAARMGAAPASTAKLLTAAALLSVRRPTDRLTTSVRVGARSGDIVLVGGGDPTLSAAAAGDSTPYPDAARISDLATAVRRAGVPVHRIVVDDALFGGPSVSPAWDAEDVPSSYGSAITAVMADGGRATPDAAIRSATPDLAAGRALAAAVGHANLPVVRGTAAASARTIATVRSAPLSVLIAQMLEQSDDVIADCLGRQVALADHRPATFTGATAAIRDVLRKDIGTDVGAGMVDASGLARRDRLSASTLVAVLRAVTTRAQLRDVVSGLPVAGWSGSLAGRYLSGAAHSAAGLVRAKTGTLTGVSALAGFVHTRSGALLAFALITNHAADTMDTEAALDTVAARLATCHC